MMQTADLTTMELFDAWYEQDPAMRIRVNFPFEEIVLILSGTVEARLGDETGRLSTGQAALVPAMVPHGIRNVGEEMARCVGFFSAATVQSTFDQPMMPFGTQMAGTPPANESAA